MNISSNEIEIVEPPPPSEIEEPPPPSEIEEYFELILNIGQGGLSIQNVPFAVDIIDAVWTMRLQYISALHEGWVGSYYMTVLKKTDPRTGIVYYKQVCMRIVTNICANCTRIQTIDETHFHKCSLCKQVRYCSKSCQTNHWSTHRTNCKRLEDMKAMLKEIGVFKYSFPF